jgi:large subunit ribosomal protein L2
MRLKAIFMAIKIYKPTTSGRRSKASVVSSVDITKTKPEKNLTRKLKKTAGRSKGKITVKHRGGGAKRKYRIIDWQMDQLDTPVKVLAIEYDPNRNARIALVEYEKGKKVYIIASLDLQVGEELIFSKNKVELKAGNRMPLEKIPAGTGIYNIELEPGAGAKMARAAGTLATLQAIEGKYAQLKMPSGEIRLVKKEAMASVGQVSNPDFRLQRLGKAGRSRHKGIRPSVRGKAMNPVDHRHGGGEGQQSIGLKRPVTAWGKPALGVRTRNKKKASNKFIVKRRKK